MYYIGDDEAIKKNPYLVILWNSTVPMLQYETLTAPYMMCVNLDANAVDLEHVRANLRQPQRALIGKADDDGTRCLAGYLNPRDVRPIAPAKLIFCNDPNAFDIYEASYRMRYATDEGWESRLEEISESKHDDENDTIMGSSDHDDTITSMMSAAFDDDSIIPITSNAFDDDSIIPTISNAFDEDIVPIAADDDTASLWSKSQVESGVNLSDSGNVFRIGLCSCFAKNFNFQVQKVDLTFAIYKIIP